MRIISGEFRGRRLVAPKGQDTRPMLDRVREAMFSTLGGQFDELRVLDLFAGTGSLGLEAISRGASFARCVESGRHALEALRRNVATFAAEPRVEISSGDALHPGRWTPPGDEPARWADVVFLDPPYPLLAAGRPERVRVLQAVNQLVEEVLAPDGALVLHVPPRALDAADLPSEWDAERRVYGRSALWYVWGPDR